MKKYTKIILFWIERIFFVGIVLMHLFIVFILGFYHSIICPTLEFCIGRSQPQYMIDYHETVSIKPGETKRIKLNILSLDNNGEFISSGANGTFYFVTKQNKAIRKNNHTLYLGTNDQVIVSWDGVPFNSDNVYLTISATKDAKPLLNDAQNGSAEMVAKYVYLRDIHAETRNFAPVTISIQVEESK